MQLKQDYKHMQIENVVLRSHTGKGQLTQIDLRAKHILKLSRVKYILKLYGVRDIPTFQRYQEYALFNNHVHIRITIPPMSLETHNNKQPVSVLFSTTPQPQKTWCMTRENAVIVNKFFKICMNFTLLFPTAKSE